MPLEEVVGCASQGVGIYACGGLPVGFLEDTTRGLAHVPSPNFDKREEFFAMTA